MSVMSKLNVLFNELFGVRNVETRRSSLEHLQLYLTFVQFCILLERRGGRERERRRKGGKEGVDYIPLELGLSMANVFAAALATFWSYRQSYACIGP